MNKEIITPTEADIYLSAYADWTDLSDPLKVIHISKGSVYAQLQWECVDVDWDDTINIPDNIKEAVAYYAYANFGDQLYGDPTEVSEVGQLNKKLVKVGSVTTSKSYFRGKDIIYGAASPFGYPDSLMRISCTEVTSSNSTTLIRN